MNRLIAAAAVAFAASAAVAAPKAQHPNECHWYWDVAITARAAAMEGIERETSRRVIWRIFTTEVERVKEIANLVVDTAHTRPRKPDEKAGDFAAELSRACSENGDMDAILSGERL